ncbi:M16 family metallopeptidase [Mucilaginibacter sp. SJ]|uniref:M16 family metallopeptidase n=1 Tax=Mucilaginibacter sp. SJ TaxID=3029053 RepID=UPI0023A9D51A|nr:insulinase family protein [Mucilaginibacter sp. SJ]WEA04027.1 insulinase family protein [Mucilaginibacter sp. SJ]
MRVGHLSNGFTYFIRHNEAPKDRVVMYLANKIGSIVETDDQRGLAHFMEHMSFNGTKHYPKNELVDYLQKVGVRFGADINAYTNFDETVYQLPLPSDKPDVLANGLQIMRDWAQDATLDPTEIDKERGVVLEEKRLGKGASERMRRQYYPVLLNGSRYSQRIPIGTDEVLNGFKPEAIRQFYHDWYRPDLQGLIVVGDIDVDQMEQLVKAKFSDLKNPSKEQPRIKYGVSLVAKNQFIALTDPEKTSTSMEVMIKYQQPDLKTTTDFRSMIIRDLFDQLLSARFSELSRQADPPFIQGGAGIGELPGGLAMFDASVTAKPGELERGMKAVWREIERIKRFGFTQTELDRVKSGYLNRFTSALKEKNKTSSNDYVQEYLQFFLKGTAAPGIETEARLVQHELPNITLSDLNSLVKERLADHDRDILITAPAKDKNGLPDAALVDSWLKAVVAEKLSPYIDAMSSKPLLAKEPIAGKIVSEQRDEVLGTTTLTLSNGVKVLLKPTDFKNDQIVFTAFSPGGTSLYSDLDFQSASNAAGIINASGAGNYTPTELGKYLVGKQVRIIPYIGERLQGINGLSTPQDLETALMLIYAKLTEPRLDTNVFKSIIDRSKASLANRANDPTSVFQDSITTIANNYNIRRTGPSLTKLEQIDLERAFHIYQERFADASALTFVFVGSLDLEKIKPLLAKYIGSLPATHKHEQAIDLGIHLAEGRIEKNIYKGTEPKATVNLVFSGKFDYNAVNKVLLDALKENLEIRLIERLRENESGVYSPAVSANASKFPTPRYSFVISFGCAPQNVDKLIVSTLDEIEKLKTVGPMQVNIDKYRAEATRLHETQIKTNTFWLSYLNEQLQNEDDLHLTDNYSVMVNHVDQANIKMVAQRYLGGSNLMRFVLLPEN